MRLRTKRLLIPSLYCPLMPIYWKAVLRKGMLKRSVIGMDPLLVPLQKYTPECLPPVEACDILSYLVLETSFYTKEQFKNFRSLLAYNQMVSGFITSVLGQIIQDKFVVLVSK